ncbi:MAG: hypothetical protein N4A49_11565 [Marinifilaceae bacterium]|jgi:hypothetical protein|nr:hypothetical protein [Marinifilaceae bacterium]
MIKEEIQNLIQELNLPNIVLELFNRTEKAKELDLDIEFGCPSEFFIMEEKELEFFQTASIKPLLADGSFYQIYAYDIEKKGFLTYNTEDENITENRYKWEALFIKDILNWWEEEIPDEDIIKRGNLLGLDHIAELLKCVEALEEDTSIDIEKWEQEMIEKFDLQII